jgi:hypothetical protein
MAASSRKVYFPAISVAKALVLRCLGNGRGELSPRDVLAFVHASSLDLREIDAKRAIWQLIHDGEIVFSPDQRLRANKVQLSFSPERPLGTIGNSALVSTEEGLSAVDGVA